MRFLDILIILSAVSFLLYGIAYFSNPHMKNEFVRFGLAKFGILIAALEILGAIGLMVGLVNNFALLISSGGLAILMLLGFLARLRVKDSLWVSLPALFYIVLNSYIFLTSVL